MTKFQQEKERMEYLSNRIAKLHDEIRPVLHEIDVKTKELIRLALKVTGG